MTDHSAQSKTAPAIGRRRLLGFGMAAAGAVAVLDPGESLAMVIKAPPRQLAFHNLHTGEHLKTEYWAKGRYSREGLRAINRLMRDYRTGAVHPIDPQLLDVLYTLSRRFGGRKPLEVVSGYRSPETNAMLREADMQGVASHSYHMEGKAVDLRIPGLPLRALHRAALAMRAGGVGYYPSSDFVHVDVGPIRAW